jgi:hypothetical protein
MVKSSGQAAKIIWKGEDKVYKITKPIRELEPMLAPEN